MKDLERRLVEVLRRTSAVRAAWLFGSLAEGRECAGSDVDVAILTDAPLDLDARAELSLELSRVAQRRCDLVVVRDASPVLGVEIVRARKRLFADDEAAADRWEDFAVRRYLGTAHLRKIVHDSLTDWAQERERSAR